MAKVIFLDNGLTFDGTTIRKKALGGAESALVNLAEALAAQKHHVEVYNNCEKDVITHKVHWYSCKNAVPSDADLYIVNRDLKLFKKVPKGKQLVFWIHTPAQSFGKLRRRFTLWKYNPHVLFSSIYHLKTWPKSVTCRSKILMPLSPDNVFLKLKPVKKAPRPKVIFLSNPLRGLDKLLDQWKENIHPKVPTAELHIFSGAKTYGNFGDKKASQMAPILKKARSYKRYGVIVNAPIAKPLLAKILPEFRLMMYQGDLSETYCLALAEAQAAGIPCVVGNLGCVSERIINKKTGFATISDEDFIAKSLLLLSDNKQWLKMSQCAAKTQKHWDWNKAARSLLISLK
ncbi:MAG: glycosyltransferase [Rickettsiales bacterium]